MRRVERPTVRDEPRKLIVIRFDAKVLSWLRETTEENGKPHQSLRASEYAGPDPQRYQHLADALRAGRLAGAAMDLCDPLPVSMTDPMLDAPRTVLTPHMAWQTSETFCRAATMSVENILNYFRGQPSDVANPDALKVSRQRLQPSR